MSKELYFCLYLTSGEHEIVEYTLMQKCIELNLNLKYYRELKDGHIPMYREVKVIGEHENLNRFKAFLKLEHYDDNIAPNPYKIKADINEIYSS